MVICPALRDAGTVISYQRRGFGPIEVTAVVGGSADNSETETGLAIQTHYRDFTISTDSLLALSPPYPVRNDKIVVVRGTEVLTYIVNADGGVSHFEEADAYNVAWRVHTIRDVIAPSN